MPATDPSPDREIIIGDYGLITNIVTSGEDKTDKIPPYTWVEVSEKASASSKFGDIPVGGLYYSPVEITLTSGDKWKEITESIIGFARSWQVEFARNSIDTTALKDLQSTSIFGRPTVTGSIGGFLVTNDAGADVAISRFMDTHKVAATGAVTTIKRNASALAFIGYTLKREANRPYIEAYHMPNMDIGSLTIGTEVGGLTDFTSPLALRSGAIARYEIAVPSA